MSLNKIYETFILLLVLISILFIWIDFKYMLVIDYLIWIILVLDYSIRLYKAKDRKKFFRENIVDFIAILPLDNIFRSLRLVRVFRVFRLGVLLYRYAKPFFKVLSTNGLNKVLCFSAVIVFIGGILVSYLEPNINTLEDGIWWAMVTITTVGYGDISPQTTFGRIIAMILMLVGIGTLGMVTGSIATYFVSEKEKDRLPPAVRFIQEELNRYHHLSEAEMRHLLRSMESLVELKKEQSNKPS
jgi:voltage-gated potassium channel